MISPPEQNKTNDQKPRQPMRIKTPDEYRKEIQEADLWLNEKYRRLDLKLKTAILEQLMIINDYE